MSNSVKISAVIITLNEENRIQACLDSIKDVVDEIVVIDSFSTDKTQEICDQYNVRFIKHEWEGYGAQKNWGNKQASHDYILSLDADEQLSEELKKAILDIKNDWQYDIYAFNRTTYFHGQKLKYTLHPDHQLRLFNKTKTQWNLNKVHERIISKGLHVKYIGKSILHDCNDNIHEQIYTLNNNSTLSANDNFELGKKISFFKLLFSPLFSFIKDYIFKLGFLDGFYGFVFCINKAHYRFLKYAKRIELDKENKKTRK